MSLEQAILDAIDADAVVALALELSDLPDLAGRERAVAEGVAAWAGDQGMPAYLQELSPTSANVIVEVAPPAKGGAPALMLNAHLDTEGGPPSGAPDRVRRLRGAWQEGDLLIGKGLVNDRIHVAAQLVAARALVRSGAPLAGGLRVVGVAQETGAQVTDAPPGQGTARDEPPHHGEGGGTRALLEAGVRSHRAIVGEPNGFALSGAQCGFLRLRIDLDGQMPYTPFVERLYGAANPYEVAGLLVTRLVTWAKGYECSSATEFWGGRIVPKAQVSGIRSWGWPYTEPTDRCTVYVEVRTPPRRHQEDVEGEIQDRLTAIVSDVVGGTAEVALTVVDRHPGLIAPEHDPAVTTLREVHAEVHGTAIAPPAPPQVSMWHDTNAYLAHGIPAVSYGIRVVSEPYTIEGRRAVLIDDAVALARVYALAAARLCGRPTR